jgi:hypothetical protein
MTELVVECIAADSPFRVLTCQFAREIEKWMNFAANSRVEPVRMAAE